MGDHPAPFERDILGGTMYLHIGNNVMLPEKHIIGVFDLEITSQSKRTSEFLRRAEDESLVIDACEDIPKSFLVCDHPYHPQLVYLSELSSQTLQKRMEEQT
ncbi:MAG: DUF370 domain-containing protein [Oscillibacter sp.]|nr:DUF370 domain-containing protein [Oscillibacter sp.]